MRYKKRTSTSVDSLDKRARGLEKCFKEWTTNYFRCVKSFHQTDLKAHFGCVNGLSYSNNNELLASGGDDRRVLIWPVSESLTICKTNPQFHVMKETHVRNVFAVSFNASDQLLLSAGNGGKIMVHDVPTGVLKESFALDQPVYSIDADPSNDFVFTLATHEGEAFIYDLRSNERPVLFAKSDESIHSVQYNPACSQYLASVSSDSTPLLWDLRNLAKPVLVYGYCGEEKYKGMSVSFNKYGTRLLAIGRWSHPLVYDTLSPRPLHHFYDSGYSCACTLKNGCWAGPNHEFIATGSDDFGVYMWEVPDISCPDNEFIDTASRVLRGHRSIVTQVQYNETYSIMASSGVEKLLKLWSPFSISGTEGRAREPQQRYIYLQGIIESGMLPGFISDSHEEMSVEEDPRMLCYFDNIIREELKVPANDVTNSLDLFIPSSDDEREEVKQYLPTDRQRSLVTISRIIRCSKDRDETDWKRRMMMISREMPGLDDSKAKDNMEILKLNWTCEVCANLREKRLSEVGSKRRKNLCQKERRSKHKLKQVQWNTTPNSSQSAQATEALRRLKHLEVDEDAFEERLFQPSKAESSHSSQEKNDRVSLSSSSHSSTSASTSNSVHSSTGLFKRLTKFKKRKIRARESDSDG
ncbi:DDB1- and CUL4-associated factor 5-like [Watersipora subatra]|uniref:DDB1- and CUL4-associated factor 5-like n=1 Tax=Watersipora subatra TaxID=2589382 RepID=UPI00355BF87F